MSAAAELALAEQYRQTQLRIRANFVRDYLIVWTLLDLRDIGSSSPNWLRIVVSLLRRYHGISATVASRYVVEARQAALGERADVKVLLRQLDDDAAIRSLLATGPGKYVDALRRGRTPVQAERTALATSTGSATRLVLDGGRDFVTRTVEADRKALGFARVTDGDPCDFCAMLASRGAVYKSAESAGFRDARDVYGDPKGLASHWHDACGCQLVPAYTRPAPMAAKSRQLDQLWKDATVGLSGNAARKAYRRALEGRVLEGDPLWKPPAA